MLFIMCSQQTRGLTGVELKTVEEQPMEMLICQLEVSCYTVREM